MKFIISRNVGWEITYVKRRSRITRKNQRRNRLIEVKMKEIHINRKENNKLNISSCVLNVNKRKICPLSSKLGYLMCLNGDEKYIIENLCRTHLNLEIFH